MKLNKLDKDIDELISTALYEGDDAFYTVIDGYGVKIIPPYKKSPDRFSYDSPKETYENIKEIQKLDLDIFPKIYEVELDENDNIIIVMEHIIEMNTPNEWHMYPWLPSADKEYLKEKMNVSLRVLDRCNKIILKNELSPDSSWFKLDANFIGNKIVDFHRFKVTPGMYKINSKGKTVEELTQLYDTFLKRYKEMPNWPVGKPVKWYRAGIYEGFHFDNDYDFKGYSSDKKEYDSYRKLNFQFLKLAKDSTILDIGSNQGFFCFQSVFHGAKKVIGIEKTIQDWQTAVDINDNIFNYDEITFKNEDAIPYVMNTKDKYDIVVMNSVFHQLYPHFEGGDAFLKRVSDMTLRHMVFETPVNHNKMSLNLKQIEENLQKYFVGVRLAYIYDAYSPGYRAVFICKKDGITQDFKDIKYE